MFLLSAILGAVLLGCDRKPREQTITISDVKQAQMFNLTPTNEPMINISTITLRFRGQLDGTAYIVPQAAQTQKLSGAVSSTWSGDVSANAYLLQYIPGSATTGTLSVTYVLR
jgi:hypothetical protein